MPPRLMASCCELAGELEVFDGFGVFVGVPVDGRLLCEAGAVASHALYEFVGDLETELRPGVAGHGVAVGHGEAQGQPEQEDRDGR
jgi:hypothetical protein